MTSSWYVELCCRAMTSMLLMLFVGRNRPIIFTLFCTGWLLRGYGTTELLSRELDSLHLFYMNVNAQRFVDTYWYQWSCIFFQVMACCLFGAKPLREHNLISCSKHVYLTTNGKLIAIIGPFLCQLDTFHSKNPFENVLCKSYKLKMSALCRPNVL